MKTLQALVGADALRSAMGKALPRRTKNDGFLMAS